MLGRNEHSSTRSKSRGSQPLLVCFQASNGNDAPEPLDNSFRSHTTVPRKGPRPAGGGDGWPPDPSSKEPCQKAPNDGRRAKWGRPRKWENQLHNYLRELEEAEYSDLHIKAINRIIRKAFQFWDSKEPGKVDQQDIRSYLSQWPEGRNRIYQRTIINGYLRFCSNFVIQSMRWRDPVDVRFKVRWLTKSQYATLVNLEMDPLDELVIRLALDMGLRRVEISRILLTDIDRTGYLTVRGKGKKLRTVPFFPGIHVTLDRWLQERERLVSIFPGPYPDHLIIVRYRKHLTAIKRTALDNIYKRVSKIVGFHFSYHDLRRTWARTAWEIGVPIETIAMILGHRDTKTTLRYIGANADHANEAMQKLHLARMNLLDKECTRNDRKVKTESIEPEI